jgi:hypothetical protein
MRTHIGSDIACQTLLLRKLCLPRYVCTVGMVLPLAKDHLSYVSEAFGLL